METTADLLVHITLKQLIVALVGIISYTFFFVRAYFHVLSKIRELENQGAYDRQTRQDKENYIEKLIENQRTYREEIMEEMAVRYENQIQDLSLNFKHLFEANRKEHEQFLETLNVINTELKQHLSYEAGLKKGQQKNK